jgi:hypothetical protein
MPDLLIQLTKRPDGGAMLRCVRANGSATWQRHRGHQAGFFPRHDLTHYAVETILGFRRGFFGLIADGWDVEETEGRSAQGSLPAEAIAVEHIVGFLEVEAASGAEWSAAEFSEFLDRAGVGHTFGGGRSLTDDDLARVRALRQELMTRWAALAPGEILELSFARSVPAL